MKLIILCLAAVLLMACDRANLNCADGKPHAWGRWSDVTVENDGLHSRLYQIQNCEKCNVSRKRYVQ